MRILVAADVIERFETFATVAAAPVNVDRPRDEGSARAVPEPVDGTASKTGRGVGIPIDSPPSRRTRYPGATLSLFGFRAKAFGAESETIGAMLANHAAIALIHERRERQFRAALSSRDIIGQATGMIMERFDVERVERSRC